MDRHEASNKELDVNLVAKYAARIYNEIKERESTAKKPLRHTPVTVTVYTKSGTRESVEGDTVETIDGRLTVKHEGLFVFSMLLSEIVVAVCTVDSW